MNASQQDRSIYETAIEDRISFIQKIIYGLGSLCNNLLAASLGCMAIVLNLGLGMNPALIGAIMSLSRLTDALTDPIMGYVSDHTRSRWGRRRPYIFSGAILAGLIFALMWQIPSGHSERFYFWVFLIGTNIFYIAYTIFATPFIALGYELTPDYHERTRLMGFSNFIGQFAWMAVPWFYAIMENDRLFDNSVQGAKGLAIAVGAIVVVVGALPAIFFKERYQSIVQREEKGKVFRGLLTNITEFFKSFLITIRFRPFLKLCAATFLVFNGFMMVSGFGSYVIIYYLYGGNKDLGATLMGWFGTVSSICTFCVIALITWLSTKIGKRKAFFVSTSISIVGYALKWFCYNPAKPLMLLIPAPLIAFGLGGLFTLVGAMMADVCDLDELENGHRREGMFGAIYWWVVKLGMALAFALSGYLLNATGFDVALGNAQAPKTLLLLRAFDVGIPIVASALAIWAIASYKITEAKAHSIRQELELRRGKAAA
ncbi:MAG TPA: MFS transporter [Verrucomicrobia bacterium]|nr:MAG: sugar:proton symporter [Lentisphaerae bacterium GWF2_57_35]HBA85738.1 MFS transporter [Verrucomicrobiota bacterium]